ncbi:extracellular solute-binding protein [Bombella apis]|uniref:extracellular solute-binding protein n=1 Tax=Bombella apis TaxID=1785988 RepID=UPI0023F6C4D9|nr:extracellular solute-binding protein [Bombella apis]MCT6813585.1 extracellular solute-binding protein [Bombella apis]
MKTVRPRSCQKHPSLPHTGHRLFRSIMRAVCPVRQFLDKIHPSIGRLPALCLALTAMAGAAPVSAMADAASTQTDPAPQDRTYYWAIPEHDLIGPILRDSTSMNLAFLSREGRGLDEIEQQALAYPQTVQAIMLDSTESAIACARAWLQPLHALGRCGRSAGFFRNVLFWDTSRITTPPHWPTLWDVARYPGQRAFFQGPRMTLEIALLADGVPPNQVYAQLSTPAGIDRAFHKLNQLRPYIIWWRSPSEAYHILQKQAVLMGITPGAIILSPKARNTLVRPYQAEMGNVLYSPAMWAIPATLPTEQANEIRTLLLKNPPHLPYPPSPIPAESLEISDGFWATHELLLSERFNAWLTHTPLSRPLTTEQTTR